VKSNEKLDEQNLIVKNVNQWLANSFKEKHDDKLFVIKTEYLEEEMKRKLNTSFNSENLHDVSAKNSPKLFLNHSVLSNPSL
jgi:hypothetical protein